jgi:hypothetical protein
MIYLGKQETEMDRATCEVWATVSTFLGGIFFTSLILVMQERAKFDYSFTFMGTVINAVDMISFPLALTFVMFTFAAICFADASWRQKSGLVDAAMGFFAIGFFSLLVSLVLVLLQISVTVAVFGLILCILATIRWIIKSR